MATPERPPSSQLQAPPPLSRGACHLRARGKHQITRPHAAAETLTRRTRRRVWLRRINKNCEKVGHLITETKRHRERSFCLKNGVATCKYVLRSNFITNCPIGQRLGNDGTLCSFLRAPGCGGADGRGNSSPGSRARWPGVQGAHWAGPSWLWAPLPPFQAAAQEGP